MMNFLLVFLERDIVKQKKFDQAIEDASEILFI